MHIANICQTLKIIKPLPKKKFSPYDYNWWNPLTWAFHLFLIFIVFSIVILYLVLYTLLGIDIILSTIFKKRT